MWQNTDLDNRNPLRMREGVVNAITKSTGYKNKWAARIFEVLWRMGGFHRVSKREKTFETTRPSGFIVFERLET